MKFAPVFAFTDGDRWHPGIGDPTFVGWLTVAAYAMAAVLCFRQVAASREDRDRFWFWTLLGTMMVLLGINKQLDLQTWLTLTARRLATEEGWYDRRRGLQFIFIALIAAGGMAGFALLWRRVQHFGSDLALPLLGIFVVLCFVIIRAASFHHVDEFLGTRVAGFKMNWLLELSGIGMIIAGSARRNAPEERGPETSLQDA